MRTRKKAVYKQFTDEYLLERLRAAADRLGHTPSQRNMEEMGDMPSRSAYRNHFGTFANAVELSGLKPVGHGSLSPNHPRHKRFNPKNGLVKHSRKKYTVRPPRRTRGGPSWRKLRFEVLQRDNFTCQYCGRTPQDGAVLEVDHVKPFSRGGVSEQTNLLTSCKECNIGKGDVLLGRPMNIKTSNGWITKT